MTHEKISKKITKPLLRPQNCTILSLPKEKQVKNSQLEVKKFSFQFVDVLYNKIILTPDVFDKMLNHTMQQGAETFMETTKGGEGCKIELGLSGRRLKEGLYLRNFRAGNLGGRFGIAVKK